MFPTPDTTSSSGERGQAATEFAISLPILCLLLIGIIQYGQLIWTHMELNAATRDGARRAAVARADETETPQNQVRNVLRSSLDRVDPNSVTVDITGGWAQDSDVTVAASMPYEMNIMGVEVWSGNLRSSHTVRIG